MMEEEDDEDEDAARELDSLDYRTCRECDSSHDPENEAWYRTSCYNFYPKCDSDYVPKFATKQCAECGKSLNMNGEGSSYGPKGYSCAMCGLKAVRGAKAKPAPQANDKKRKAAAGSK